MTLLINKFQKSGRVISEFDNLPVSQKIGYKSVNLPQIHEPNFDPLDIAGLAGRSKLRMARSL